MGYTNKTESKAFAGFYTERDNSPSVYVDNGMMTDRSIHSVYKAPSVKP
jgi:hypothetical protein